MILCTETISQRHVVFAEVQQVHVQTDLLQSGQESSLEIVTTSLLSIHVNVRHPDFLIVGLTKILPTLEHLRQISWHTRQR